MTVGAVRRRNFHDNLRDSLLNLWNPDCYLGEAFAFVKRRLIPQSAKEPAAGGELTMACHVEIAEKELAAFVAAVSELFGTEQSLQAAEDWMEELGLMDWPTGETIPDFRQVTIAAAARLSRRVNALDILEADLMFDT